MTIYYLMHRHCDDKSGAPEMQQPICELIASGRLSTDFDAAYKSMISAPCQSVKGEKVTVYKLELKLPEDNSKNIASLLSDKILKKKVISPAFTIIRYLVGFDEGKLLELRQEMLEITCGATILQVNKDALLYKLKQRSDAGGIKHFIKWNGRSGEQVRIECTNASDMKRIMGAIQTMPGMAGLVKQDVQWTFNPEATIAIFMPPEEFLQRVDAYESSPSPMPRPS